MLKNEGAKAWRSHNHVAEARLDAWVVRKQLKEDRLADAQAALGPLLFKKTPKGNRFSPFDFHLGARLGTLTLTKRLSCSRSRGWLWLCTCDCGEGHKAYGPTLTDLARRGQEPTCEKCKALRDAADLALRRELVSEAFVKQFVDYGTLWTVNQANHLAEEIREDLETEFGYERDLEFTVGRDDSLRMHESNGHSCLVSFDVYGDSASSSGTGTSRSRVDEARVNRVREMVSRRSASIVDVPFSSMPKPRLVRNGEPLKLDDLALDRIGRAQDRARYTPDQRGHYMPEPLDKKTSPLSSGFLSKYIPAGVIRDAERCISAASDIRDAERHEAYLEASRKAGQMAGIVAVMEAYRKQSEEDKRDQNKRIKQAASKVARTEAALNVAQLKEELKQREALHVQRKEERRKRDKEGRNRKLEVERLANPIFEVISHEKGPWGDFWVVSTHKTLRAAKLAQEKFDRFKASLKKK